MLLARRAHPKRNERAQRAGHAEPRLLESRTEVGTTVVALARQTGDTPMLVAVLRAADQAPPAAAARDLLNDLMSDISQAIVCAGWLRDLEFLLWELLESGTLPDALDPWGFRALTAADRTDLRWLADLAGGWWRWSDDSNAEVFIETSAWRDLHARWSRAQPP